MIPRTKTFQDIIWSYYRENKRDFAWRETRDPYHILVSEVMLQQTQTERVKAYYMAFLNTFPTVTALSEAKTAELLTLWKGLGYNRRALFLKKTAEAIMGKHNGIFPKDYASLLALPGVGPSTAGAIMNFAYGNATPFIETNIRAVYIHFFFQNTEDKNISLVHDKDILNLIEKTQDRTNPREWYYALYDYGVFLKKYNKVKNNRSVHYNKQSTFKGSNRELRAKMLFHLVDTKKTTLPALQKIFNEDSQKIEKNLEAFIKEGVIKKVGRYYEIV